MTAQKKRPGNSLFTIILITIISGFNLPGCKSSGEYRHIQKLMEFSGENPATFRVRFEGCACGEEYPEYVVDSVLYSENVEASFYLNKQFTLEYQDPSWEQKFQLRNCKRDCYYLILHGNAERNGYGMNRLFVDSGTVHVDSTCCFSGR